MEEYFPLELKSKVISGDYLSNKRLGKRKRKLTYNDAVNIEEKICLDNILAIIYSNLKKYMNNLFYGPTPDVLYCLRKIIPLEYYGSNLNKKRFEFIVKRILTQTRGEFIHMCVLFERFDYSAIPWLDPQVKGTCQILHANINLLQTVVKPFIRFYYCFLSSSRDREYQMIMKGKVHSFIDKNLAKSIKEKKMTKITPAPNNKLLSGKLNFFPKRGISQLDHRPILFACKCKDKSAVDELKKNLKLLIRTFQIGNSSCIYEKWVSFVEHNKRRKKLYGIKLDLLDAFGMVDLEQLKSIIQNDKQFLTDGQKANLYQIISQQFVRVRGSTYKWSQGLLQGARISPALCELYLSFITYNSLKHFDKSNCFLHRTVDDMFFVSTCESDIDEFEIAAFAMATINETKTSRFLGAPDDNPQIVFFGKIFNLVTRETSSSFDFPCGKELRIKFKFWNRKNSFSKDEPHKFIVHSMQFSYVNFYFSRFELNTTCNSAETVLKNIFDGFCFVGFKLFYVMESIEYLFSSTKQRSETIISVINFITSKYPRIIKVLILKFKGEHHETIFPISIIQFLCLKAFIIVLQRRHYKYREVIMEMKKRLKSNKISFKKHIDLKYFSKLPKPFENISMRRSIIQKPILEK